MQFELNCDNMPYMLGCTGRTRLRLLSVSTLAEQFPGGALRRLPAGVGTKRD